MVCGLLSNARPLFLIMPVVMIIVLKRYRQTLD